MKWLTTVAMLLICCLALTAQSKAEEYGKKKAERAKNRTENRADNKVDRAVDRAVDNVFNGVEGMFKKKKKNKKNSDGDAQSTANNDAATDHSDDDANDAEAANAMLQGMFGGKVDIEDAYTFDLSIDFQITTTDKKGKEEQMDMTMMYPKEASYTGTTISMEGTDAAMITDLDRMVSITITGEQAMVMNMKKMMNRMMEKANEEYDADNENYSFRKTGVKKTIAGYETDEYEFKDLEEGTTTLIYMAHDLKQYGHSAMGFANAFNQAGTNQLNVSQSQFDEMGGMMLGMHMTDRKNEKVEMLAQRVSETPVTFDMSKYQIMKLPGM